jgi:hypothetical protein
MTCNLQGFIECGYINTQPIGKHETTHANQRRFVLNAQQYLSVNPKTSNAYQGRSAFLHAHRCLSSLFQRVIYEQTTHQPWRQIVRQLSNLIVHTILFNKGVQYMYNKIPLYLHTAHLVVVAKK